MPRRAALGRSAPAPYAAIVPAPPSTAARPAEPGEPPAAFRHALESLHRAQVRPEIVLTEVPAPQRLAPYGCVLAAEIVSGGSTLADGRFVVLHDPAGQEEWHGTTRIAAYVRAEIDADMASDPLLSAVGWTWLTEALDAHGADHVAVGGTVTRTASCRFGLLADEPDEADVELRASWSPAGDDLGAHLAAWCDVLGTAAGLPPPGVATLPPRGSR